jgi:hypothetical protein
VVILWEAVEVRVLHLQDVRDLDAPQADRHRKAATGRVSVMTEPPMRFGSSNLPHPVRQSRAQLQYGHSIV